MGKLYLISDDIISNSVGKDAIVNAQNKYMQNGSGICGAIYRAAGIELLEYCQSIYKEYMNVGEVRITPGFNLKMDIIHVLAPKAFEEKQPLEKLLECYNNLLDEIKKHNYKTVILPSLGTGIHGYEHKDVAKPLMIMLNNFCNNNDVDLYFINLNPIVTDIYLNEYLKIKGLILKNDLSILEPDQMKEYLFKNGLVNDNIKYLYMNYIDGKELEDICLEEKIICLQYTLEYFKLTTNQLLPLINSMGDD